MAKRMKHNYMIEREFLGNQSCKNTIEKILNIYIDLALEQNNIAYTAIGKDD